MDEQPILWAEIFAMLWRRRALVAGVFACGLVTAIVLASLQGPTYRASAKIMVTAARATVTVSPNASERATVDRIDDSYLNSESALLGSKELLRDVLDGHRDRLDQDGNGFAHGVSFVLDLPRRLPRLLYGRILNLPPADPFEPWLDLVAKHVSVSVINRSNLIEVAYEAGDPKWAAQLVNELVAHHVKRHVRLNEQATAQEFFESQRQLLSDKLRRAEEALRAFYQQAGVASVRDRQSTLSKRLADLEAALAGADAELAETKAKSESLASLTGRSANHGPENALSTSSNAAQLIKTRIIELQLQRSQLLSQFAPTSMKIQDIDRQIAEAQRLLAAEGPTAPGWASVTDPALQALQTELAQSKAQMAAIQARMETLRSQISTDRAQLDHLDAIAAEPERLEQEVTTARETLLTYVRKEEEARFSNALDESGILNLKVVERATVPHSPQPSKRALTLVLATVMSLCAGIGLAFVRDRLDPAVKSAAEAQRVTNLPILAEIPR